MTRMGGCEHTRILQLSGTVTQVIFWKNANEDVSAELRAGMVLALDFVFLPRASWI